MHLTGKIAKDGKETRRDYYRTFAERRGGIRHKDDVDLPIPVAGEQYWDWFNELSMQRGSGFVAPQAITFSEIMAWATLTARNPNPWEVQLICLLDAAYRHAISIRDEPPDPTQDPDRIAKREAAKAAHEERMRRDQERLAAKG